MVILCIQINKRLAGSFSINKSPTLLEHNPLSFTLTGGVQNDVPSLASFTMRVYNITYIITKRCSIIVESCHSIVSKNVKFSTDSMIIQMPIFGTRMTNFNKISFLSLKE